MFFSRSRFILTILFLNIIELIPVILLFLFFVSFFVCFIDSSIAFCMEQDCRYVVNNEGNIQLHPKTGEPLQDCKTTKSDYVVAIETIERVAKQVATASDAASKTTDCNACK
jgi:hypothetical protein